MESHHAAERAGSNVGIDPGGFALRFARVKRYRPDKDPAQADTVAPVRELYRLQ